MPGKVANMPPMKFAALPHENILFPVPYAENEEHKLIITNQRIVQRSAAGAVEVPTKEVHTVARQMIRPRLAAGVMLLCLALPLAIFGAYEMYSVWGMTAAGPLSLFGVQEEVDPNAPPAPAPAAVDVPEGEDAVDWPKTVLLTRIIGAVCLLAALGSAIGARRLVKKKRYFVICRAPKRMVKIEAKDEIQQTMIMVTVSAVKGKAPPPK
ncbi:MAG: hypothetical protein JWN44_4226 [Myxococcales bacterium]|nr:hypothetical protein [Myxococcales bacterium]